MAVKVGSFAKSTAAATASQAVTGVGFRPRALILWTAGTTGAGAWEQGIEYAIGFAARNAADTITVGSMAFASEDNAATTNTGRGAAVKALSIRNASATIIAECDLSSFDGGGFTLSWTTNDANAFIINYMAIGGGSITDAFVNAWSVSTSNGNQSVTGVGFQPDAVLHIMDGPVAGAVIGAMTSAAQWTCYIRANDNAASAATFRIFNTSRILTTLLSNGLIDGYSAYVSMDADGFTVENSSIYAGTWAVYSLCLKGGSYKVGSFTAPSTPDSEAITGVGFQPDAVFFTSTGTDSATVSTVDAILSVGAYDGSNVSALISDNSGADPTNCAGVASATYAVQFDEAGDQTITAQGAGASLDSDGFTLAWASGDSDGVGYLALATGKVGNVGIYGKRGGVGLPGGVRIEAVQ